MAPRGLQLVLLDYTNHRWATDQVLAYLDAQDAMRLVVAALETGDRGFMRLAAWLMDGDAPLPKLPTSELLDEAVQLGCWEVAEGLIQRLGRTEKSVIDWDRTSRIFSQDESSFGRVMDAITQSSLTLSTRTIAAKAAQGDVIAVQCLLDAIVSNDTSVHGLTNREEAARMAFKAAAEARQFHVCDWLATNSYMLCILPWDRDLQAVCCFQRFGRGWQARSKLSYLCATAKYGFEQQLLRDNESIGSALMGHFARHGDLKMLKMLESRWMLDAVHVLGCAVEGGQLAVVDWILNTFPCSLGVQMEHGVLAMQTCDDASRTLGKVVRKTASHGHVDILRWFQQCLDGTIWKLHETGMLLEAVKTNELGVVRFLHEECNVRLTTWPFPEFVESASVDFVAYFLDMLGPQSVNGCHLLGIAAAQANRDVVEYLVLHRGLWYPQALARAVYRGSTNKSTASVEISRFLYAHAQTRARELQTSLETEIEFGSVKIFKATTYGNYETARWLAECVLEVDTAATLAPLSPQDEAVFPNTPEAQALVCACLRARREQCRGLAWMPKWTVDACCYEAFAVLMDMNHPNLHEAVPMVTSKLRDSRFLCKLLAVKRGDQRAWPASHVGDVISWAAGVGAMSVLAAVETQLQHCERGVMDRAIAKAVRNGHVEVLQWLHARALLLPRETERNGTADAVAELVCCAAQHDRIDCQRWLVTTFHVPAPLVEKMLEKATEQHGFGIACMLIKRYAP